jgi:glycosyltransferase involved in cell wall biosynthesis
MRILHVSTSDFFGGASRAAYRLHRSLLADGIQSRMLVQSKASYEDTIFCTHNKAAKLISLIRPSMDKLLLKAYSGKSKTLFSPAWLPLGGVLKIIRHFNPDLVHLHWVCDGMIRIEDLAKINIPLIWTLHDMWPFTGGCHYNEGCEGYKRNCGTCKVLGSNLKNDLSAKVWQRKKSTLTSLTNLTFVGLSRWMANAASESTLLKNARKVNLPNPINTEIFAPFDKTQARKLFKIPEDKKLILFGAINATADRRKGFMELCDALRLLNSHETELLIFGNSRLSYKPGFFSQIIHCIGHLYDEVALRALYSAADVTVVPSLQENLSNIIMESLACGTPVVGFDTGGNGDLIDHMKNGYLATLSNSSDLAMGIKWVIEHSNSNMLKDKARQKALSFFTSTLVAKQYIKLYEEVVSHAST